MLVDAIFLNFFIVMIHIVNIDFIPSILCLISIIILTIGLPVILIITIIKIIIFKSYQFKQFVFSGNYGKFWFSLPITHAMRSHDLTASKKINLYFHNGGCALSIEFVGSATF